MLCMFVYLEYFVPIYVYMYLGIKTVDVLLSSGSLTCASLHFYLLTRVYSPFTIGYATGNQRCNLIGRASYKALGQLNV